MKNLHLWERIAWGIFNIVAIALTIVFFQHIWLNYLENPTIVTLDSSNVPISKIIYPAVSICNINKISKRKAMEFAQLLNKFDKKKNIPELLDDIRLLGNLYAYHTSELTGKLTTFQEFLDSVDNLTDYYDPTKRILSLTPTCHDMLSRCTWAGKVYDCQDLFVTRMTFEGFCCIFNYARKTTRSSLYKDFNQNAAWVDPRSPVGTGVDKGLRVTLKNDYDDYFFTNKETTGYNVHIFSTNDYPDKQSGSLVEVIANLKTEVLINLEVDVVKSSAAMKSLPLNMRQCKFQSDENTIFGKYRHSDCLVDCRVQSMKSLCHCLPFTLPVDQDPTTSSFCTLMDLPCMNKYAGKWSKYYPIGTKSKSLEEESYDSLSCPSCVPTCNNIVYNVFTNIAPIISEVDNNTYINVYFSTPFSNLYKINLSQTWFEILSNLGGIASLLMGLSVISIIEVAILIYRVIWYYICKISKAF